MDYSKRILIESCLTQDKISCREATEFTGIPRTTLIREIINHSWGVRSDNDFDKGYCERLLKFPFVCNGCKHDFVCHKRKVKYSARKAEIYSQKHISESRKVIHRKKDEFDAFNEDLFKWVVLNSNTVHNYRVNHPQCIYSERQIYNLISELKLKVKPIDLKQSVKRKARKLYKKSVSIPKDYKNHRQYEDFLKYIEENKDKIVVEIDTIHGKKGDKKCL